MGKYNIKLSREARQIIKSHTEFLIEADRHDLFLTATKSYTLPADISLNDALLAFDKACQIPREYSPADRLYVAAKAIAQWVNKRMMFQFSEVYFSVKSIGSFRSGTKVLEYNEFDFLIIASTQSYSGRGQRIPDQTYENVCKYFNKWFTRLQKANSKRSLGARSKIVSVYNHGPAWCIEVGWFRDGKPNRFAVDITLGCRDNAKKLADACQDLEGMPFIQNVLTVEENAIIVKPQNTRNGNSTAVLDKKIFSVLERASPNILIVFRLLKVFITLLIPKRVKRCPDVPGNYRFCNSITSYQLKEQLYKYLKTKPKVEDWNEQMVSERLVDMLGKIRALYSADDRDPEVISFRNLEKYIRNGKVNDIPGYRPLRDKEHVGYVNTAGQYTFIDMKVQLPKYQPSANRPTEQFLYHPENPLLIDKTPEYLISNPIGKWCHYHLQSKLINSKATDLTHAVRENRKKSTDRE